MNALAGCIGPNAITRPAEALRARFGEATTAELFAQASLGRHLAAPPEAMVAEAEVTALHRVLRARLADEDWRLVAWDAGTRTGDYLLAHRIPPPAQAILRLLPAGRAAPLLARAIARHAWTFCGSGAFSAEPGHPLRLCIAGGPLSRGAACEAPVCDYYVATFERLFRRLVSPRAWAREVACEAQGAPACVFELRWRG